MQTYSINEVFFSLQGEGVRTGTPNVFVRFSGCNRECRVAPGARSIGGFDCDTDFSPRLKLTAEQLHAEMLKAAGDSGCRWVVLTGGEPALQLDRALLEYLFQHGWRLAIETNGTVEIPFGVEWITVSPKVDEGELKQRIAHEVKYVRAYGQPIPRTVVKATHKLISPAFKGQDIDPEALAWCVQLVKENPEWRLTTQQHKLWNIR